MCEPVHTCIAAFKCLLQMMIRILMTVLLMMENLLKLFLQSIYNFFSFFFQLMSLLPVCCVFLITSKLKCIMCGGGGNCGNRGGLSQCLLSAVALVIIYGIFSENGFSFLFGTTTPRPIIASACTRNATDYSFANEEGPDDLTQAAKRRMMNTEVEYLDDSDETYSLDTEGILETITLEPEVMDEAKKQIKVSTEGKETSSYNFLFLHSVSDQKETEVGLMNELGLVIKHENKEGGKPKHVKKSKIVEDSKGLTTPGEYTTVLYYMVA